METARKVAAVLVGVLVLVVVVLLARWVGEQVRGRIFTPKTVVTAPAPTAPEVTTEKPSLLTEEQKQATVSAIPKTGPVDFLFPLIGLAMFSGVFSLSLAHRKA